MPLWYSTKLHNLIPCLAAHKMYYIRHHLLGNCLFFFITKSYQLLRFIWMSIYEAHVLPFRVQEHSSSVRWALGSSGNGVAIIEFKYVAQYSSSFQVYCRETSKNSYQNCREHSHVRLRCHREYTIFSNLFCFCFTNLFCFYFTNIFCFGFTNIFCCLFLRKQN